MIVSSYSSQGSCWLVDINQRSYPSSIGVLLLTLAECLCAFYLVTADVAAVTRAGDPRVTNELGRCPACTIFFREGTKETDFLVRKGKIYE